MVYYSGIIPCCMIFLKQFTVVVFLIYYTAAGVTQQLKIHVIDCTKVKPCHCIMSGYSMFHSIRLTLYSIFGYTIKVQKNVHLSLYHVTVQCVPRQYLVTLKHCHCIMSGYSTSLFNNNVYLITLQTLSLSCDCIT